MSYNMEQMIQMLFSCTSATCPRCHLVNAICPTCCWASAIRPKCHLSHMPNVPAAKCLKCHWSRPPNVLSAICRGRHLASAKWSNAGQSSATSHSPLVCLKRVPTKDDGPYFALLCSCRTETDCAGHVRRKKVDEDDEE